MGGTQLGFRNERGIREPLLNLWMSRSVQTNKFACFVDYKKVSDTVKYEKRMQIFKQIGRANCDIRIIVNLFWNQNAATSIDMVDYQTKLLSSIEFGRMHTFIPNSIFIRKQFLKNRRIYGFTHKYVKIKTVGYWEYTKH